METALQIVCCLRKPVLCLLAYVTVEGTRPRRIAPNSVSGDGGEHYG
jgi:hypothetical protein